MRSLYPVVRAQSAGQPPHCCHCHRVSRANTVRCGGRQQFFIRRTLHPAAVLQACARRRGPTRPAGKVARVWQAAVAVGRISFLVCLQGRTGRAVSQSRRGTSVPPDRGQVTRTCPWRPVCSRGICCSSSHCLSCFPGWPKRLKVPQEATTSRGRTAVRSSGKKELSEPWCGASRTSACTSRPLVSRWRRAAPSASPGKRARPCPLWTRRRIREALLPSQT